MIKFSYLSVEINNKETISILTGVRNFNSYKIVNGKKISKRYGNTTVEDKYNKNEDKIEQMKNRFEIKL